jgi:CubicO group peptidase (beta-lactamase class C family)
MTPTPDTPQPTGLAAVDALLQPFNRSDAPGLVVGIARAGRILYRRGVGLASIEQGVTMSPRTRVRIASTSKQFTCLAVLLLAEDGLLDIDDLVYRHLPELTVLHPAGPTLRQLMQHLGGWRTDLPSVAQGLALLPAADWSEPIADPNRELNFEPGTRMMYSNTGYQLLARVVERVSGRSFEDFLRERIFAPLRMHDTESLTSDLEIRPGMAMQYQAQPASVGGGLRRGIYPSELRGSGSLVSTVDDMLRWLAHLRSPSKLVGSPDSWSRMIERPTLSTGVRLPYALGLIRHDYRGVEVIQHSGAVLGATTQMITVPAHGLDIVILVNGAPVSPVALAFQIIDALLGDALGEPSVHVPAEPHAALLGRRYHSPETGAVFGLEDAGGKLALSWLGGRGIPLRQIDGAAVVPCEDSALSPLALSLEELAGKTVPQVLTLDDGGRLLRCALLPEQAPSIASLAPSLVGRYLAPDLAIEVPVEIEGEGADMQVVVRLHGPHGRSAYRLEPLSSDVMLALPTDGLFAGMGGASIVNIDREGDRVVGLRLDAPRLSRLRFIREEALA